MYFVLSKTIGTLAIPSNAIVLIMVLGLLLWPTRYGRYGRRLTVIGALLLLIAGMSPLGTALLLPLENRYPQWDATGAAPDGIVVLGGGVFNPYVSRWRKQLTFSGSVERLLAAVDLARRYPAARIVFSGGSPDLIFSGGREADFVPGFLERYGVERDRILVDRGARDTRENAIDSKRLANPKPGQRWLLVTSAEHMPRAIESFRAVGFPVEAYPVDFRTTGWRELVAVPGSLLGGLTNLNLAVHEWEGLTIDWLSGRTPALFPAPSQ
ncbi:MAG: ElyC/SanA/YdcF family protein [Xanthobacteraceae bacterium]